MRETKKNFLLPVLLFLLISGCLTTETNINSLNENEPDGPPPDHLLTMTEAGLPAVGPCNFRVYLAIAETIAGKNLTKKQILTAVTVLSKKKIDSGSNRGRTVIDLKNNYLVNSYEEIMLYALKVLGSDKKPQLVARVDFTKGQKPPKGALISCVYTPRNSWKYPHFGLGNAKGKLIWDPLGDFSIKNITTATFWAFY